MTSELWIVFSSVLVFLMQGGFLCLEAGLTRKKNSSNVAIKNLADFNVAFMIFWLIGSQMMFSDSWKGFIGTTFSTPLPNHILLFQALFASTAITIISGATAERLKFDAYLMIAVIASLLIYPVFGHWVWNGIGGQSKGFLEEMGFRDFAGGAVVHVVGGWFSLAAVLILGPRKHRFLRGHRIPSSNVPLAVFGVIVLAVGWIGFNGGSHLTFNDEVPQTIIKTLLAASSGFSAVLMIQIFFKSQRNIIGLMNGLLAGLVSITACCIYVDFLASIFIGFAGALIMMAMEGLLERLQVDDAVGAIPVHLGGGIWGVMALAFFGDLNLMNSDLSRGYQILIQGFGLGVSFLWAFIVPYILLHSIRRIYPLRVSEQDELRGLNDSEHGIHDELSDLVLNLTTQKESQDFSKAVHVEPFTEVGVIAQAYNRVLLALNESKKRESSLAHLTGLGEMAGQVAHEVNTPLGSIRLSIQSVLRTLKEHSLGDPATKEFIQKQMELINKVVSHITNVTALMVKMAHGGLQEKLKEYEVKKVLDDALLFLRSKASQKEVNIFVEYNGVENERMSCQLTQIIQVIINLVDNSIDALHAVELKQITFSCAKIGTMIVISISDSGLGVPEDLREKIFESGFTTKTKGPHSGFGLAIARKILKEQGGDLICEKKDETTHFKIFLPCIIEEATLKVS